MIENLLFQLFMPFLINPADPEGKDAYRSGVEGGVKSYYMDDASTSCPVITLDVKAYDSEFNYVGPGIYAVSFSIDTRTLILISGSKTIAKPSVVQIIELKEEQRPAVPVAEVALIKENKVFIIYKNENLEVHGFLYKSDDFSDF